MVKSFTAGQVLSLPDWRVR